MSVIFDGVAIKPPVGPTMSGVLSLVSLFASSMIEANKVRKERIAEEQRAPGTLEEVMAQSGLKIPQLHDALVTLMGGSDEAKQAASLITQNPDPAKLLQRFAEVFAFGPAVNAGPIVTPPPPPTSADAPAAGSRPAPASGLPQFRPDFTREAREAAKAADAANAAAPPLPKFRPDYTREAREAAKAAAPPLPKFRPDYTREAREAAKAADAADPAPPPLPKFRPDYTREARDAAKVAPPPPVVAAAEGTTPRSTLVNMLERRLAAIRQKMNDDMAVLEARIEHAEIELAAVRVELRQLLAARQQPASHPMEIAEGPAPTETAAPEYLPEAAASSSGDDGALVASPGAEPGDVSPLPEPVEAAAVTALLDDFEVEVEAKQQRSLLRIIAVEQEISEARALLQREREAGGST